MKICLTILIQFSLAATLFAQVHPLHNTTIVNGYADKVAGVDFWYHSSINVAKESMLIRATTGTSSMEWQTAPVPDLPDSEVVSFIWLAGLGSSPGLASFELLVNETISFTFWVDGTNEWELTNERGVSLSFKTDMVDQHGDRFGFMVLQMPKSMVAKGKPLNIKVTGGKSDLTSWYMTFKFPIEAGLDFKPYPALALIDGNHYQLAAAGIFHVGEDAPASFYIDDKLIEETVVGFGYNYIRVKIPEVTKETEVSYRLEVADKTWSGTLTLQPVKKIQVNFVHHTHTDIGYTRSQTDILGDHLRFIDYALDYCDQTDHFPDDSKFRWTCEVSWPVDVYLQSRPQEQIDRLLKRVAGGRIEITGMYLNYDELTDEPTLVASLKPFQRFRELGIEVKTAMQNDVNGIAWALNDYFSDLGVKYLNMGTHGHRALICFDKPTLFWWESPSGNRMLAYRGEHYMIGNTQLKIHAGNFDVFEEELLSYLQELQAKGYEYDIISLQHSGFITDNSPPSVAPAEMIKRWNEKYAWPKLKTATATEFFEEMEERYGETFEVIRGAWPDWWTDGFGASAREVAAARDAQSHIIANTAGLTMAALRGARMPLKIIDRIDATNEALNFYTEHTVGYHASVREPFHKYTMEQRGIKESYAWEASRRARLIGEEAAGLLQWFFQREKAPSIIVFNTLNWQRSGLFTVYIDYQAIPRDAAFTITSNDSSEARAQVIERHSDGAYWSIWVDDIPPFGHKKFIINLHNNEAQPATTARGIQVHVMENEWYRVTIDPDKGVISSLFDKELELELVDQGAEWPMGALIYELLESRSEMESFYLKNFTREMPGEIWFESFQEGPVWNTIRFRGNTRAATRDGAYVFEVRLFNTCKRIDLAYAIEKKQVTDPEGIYNALPFALSNGTLSFDVQGGEVRAGVDQIPGSANDWNTVQTYARLSNANAQIILSSREIPLMQFGGINTGRYQAGATPETTHIYGWPMNNYWVTNFNAEQYGGIEWSYAITSIEGNRMQDAVRFGRENRTPFIARVIPGGGTGDSSWQQSWISGWPENILLVSAIPDENGKSAIFLIREIQGVPASLSLASNITGKPLKCIQVDVTGNPVPDGSVNLNPLESKFFRIIFQPE